MMEGVAALRRMMVDLPLGTVIEAEVDEVMN